MSGLRDAEAKRKMLATGNPKPLGMPVEKLSEQIREAWRWAQHFGVMQPMWSFMEVWAIRAADMEKHSEQRERSFDDLLAGREQSDETQ